MNKVRCFLGEAFRRGWIKEPMHLKVTAHRAQYEEASPFDEKEIPIIFAEALKLRGTHPYGAHPATFWLLMHLMLQTGMRVADSIRFDPKVLVPMSIDKKFVSLLPTARFPVVPSGGTKS